MKYNERVVKAWFAEHDVYLEAEYKFHPERKWRFDFCDPISKVAIECQGGLFSGGRHSRGAALLKEHEKLNEAAIFGWRVLYTIPQNLCMQEFLDQVKKAIEYVGNRLDTTDD